jgi:hypothetical protein
MRRLFGRLRQAPFNSALGVCLPGTYPRIHCAKINHISSGQLLGMLAGGGLATGATGAPVS